MKKGWINTFSKWYSHTFSIMDLNSDYRCAECVIYSSWKLSLTNGFIVHPFICCRSRVKNRMHYFRRVSREYKNATNLNSEQSPLVIYIYIYIYIFVGWFLREKGMKNEMNLSSSHGNKIFKPDTGFGIIFIK